MTWKEHIKKVDKKDIESWEASLKALLKEGRELGMPLSIIETLKKISEE